MIDAVGIADERFGHRTQVEQVVPIGIITRQTRDFEIQHNARQSQRDGGDESGKP